MSLHKKASLPVETKRNFSKENPPPVRPEDDCVRGTTSVCRALAGGGLSGYGRRKDSAHVSIPCPNVTAGAPANPTEMREYVFCVSFRRRLVARIRGLFRLPRTTRQFSFETMDAYASFPLLFRSHSLNIIYYLQYNQRVPSCQVLKMGVAKCVDRVDGG